MGTDRFDAEPLGSRVVAEVAEFRENIRPRSRRHLVWRVHAHAALQAHVAIGKEPFPRRGMVISRGVEGCQARALGVSVAPSSTEGENERRARDRQKRTGNLCDAPNLPSAFDVG